MSPGVDEPTNISDVVNVFIPIRKAQYIKEFYMEPCAAPWWVYVETFFPAFLELWIVLFFPDLEDIAKDAARRRHKHKRRQAARIRGRHAPIWTQGFTKHFFQIDGLAERGLWHWAIVNASIHGAYTWTTLINETVFCSGAGQVHRYLDSGAQAAAPIYTGFFITHLYPTETPWSTTAAHVSPGGGDTYAILTMQPMFNSPLNFGVNFFLRLTVTTLGIPQHREIGPIQLKVGERSDVSITDFWYSSAGVGSTLTWSWKYTTGGIPLIDHGKIDLVVGQTIGADPIN